MTRAIFSVIGIIVLWLVIMGLVLGAAIFAFVMIIDGVTDVYNEYTGKYYMTERLLDRTYGEDSDLLAWPLLPLEERCYVDECADPCSHYVLFEGTIPQVEDDGAVATKAEYVVFRLAGWEQSLYLIPTEDIKIFNLNGTDSRTEYRMSNGLRTEDGGKTFEMYLRLSSEDRKYFTNNGITVHK